MIDAKLYTKNPCSASLLAEKTGKPYTGTYL